MSKLIITRGLPASGKSTKADAWVAEDPTHRAQVNRDSLRLMLHDGAFVQQSEDGPGTERAVQAVRDAAISALLRRGVDVVCSDTNLPQRVARDLRRLAVLAKADFEVWDLTDVDVETCLERNAARTEGQVPESVITDMYWRYIRGKGYPLPAPEEPADASGAVVPYEARPGTPKAVMVDIDGTVALMGTRSPFDETLVHEDQPNAPVVAAVRAMRRAGYQIIFCSGRTDACYEATSLWLKRHVLAEETCLFMRKAGDNRKDSIVKREIFDERIRDKFDVRFVLDDRRQVVDAWREIGLTVFQVAPGEF